MSQKPQILPLGLSKKEKKNQKIKEKNLGISQQMPKIKQKNEEFDSIILDDTIFIKMESFLKTVEEKNELFFVRGRTAKQCASQLNAKFDKFLKKESEKKPCLLAVEENISKLISTVQILKREHLGPIYSNKYRENYRIYENQKGQIVCLCTFDDSHQK